MKKLFTTLTVFLSAIAALFAQPVLRSDSLHTGLHFNLYSLSNVSTSSLLLSGGANLNWDLSSSTATLMGTADLLDMSSTPYASQYPDANFAIKFTVGTNSQYSLFHLTSTVLEEVANNVGTGTPTAFVNYRTALTFPFTFNLINSDTYQKSGQAVKSITNHYDAYGTLKTGIGTFYNIVRNLYNDNGDTSANCWSLSPMFPVFQASSSGFTLWKLTSSTTGISNVSYNDMFDMYPNPATNELTIINKIPVSKMDIYDLSGKLQFTTTSSVINISDLVPGIYFIKIYSEKGISTQKFIKQ